MIAGGGGGDPKLFEDEILRGGRAFAEGFDGIPEDSFVSESFGAFFGGSVGAGGLDGILVGIIFDSSEIELSWFGHDSLFLYSGDGVGVSEDASSLTAYSS